MGSNPVGVTKQSKDTLKRVCFFFLRYHKYRDSNGGSYRKVQNARESSVFPTGVIVNAVYGANPVGVVTQHTALPLELLFYRQVCQCKW